MSDLESLFDEDGKDDAPKRRRDYAFEALAEIWGANPTEITQDQRGRINAALKQLREISPSMDSWDLAQEIHQRAGMWQAVYPDAELTPQALTGSWASLPEKMSKLGKNKKTTNAYAPPSDCALCGGDRYVQVFVRPSNNPRSGYEEMAPCPDCNAEAVVVFRRYDGSLFHTPSPEQVRELLELQE